MQFEVPQFIEIEDKIFGPLTWRQFLYLGGGVGLAVAIFFYSKLLFLFLGLPLALLSGALAFYPVNNRPFSFFLEAIVNYLKGQRLYLWRKKSDTVHTAAASTKTLPKYAIPHDNKPNLPRPRKDIASLSRKLELQALQKIE